MRLAQTSDIEPLARHYTEAACYAKTVGHIDWDNPFPVTTVARFVDNKELFCIDGDAGDIHASIRFVEEADERVWGPAQSNNYLYVSKLATATAVHGTGYARRIVFPLIEAYAIQNDLVGVRLDCLADNPRLQSYYKSLGFVSLGDISFYSLKQGKKLTVTRFEK